MSDACPDDQVLNRLLGGDLDAESEAQLIRHLDDCARCQDRLDSHGSDPRLNVLQEQLAASSDSPLLRDALAKIKRKNPWREKTDQAADETVPQQATHWTHDGFELIRTIGRGGMGIVFLAREKSLERVVAIKVLSPTLAADDSARERFLREARAAAAIKHPNVITIHAVADRPPLPYLVMEFVKGESLQDRLDRVGPLKPEQVARVAAQLAAGLAQAHARGVVHRDVKPANALIDSDLGAVKLSDFGLARAVGHSKLTQTGMLVGTPSYIAPELLDDRADHDHRADLFSLGCVMYAMCCGSSPFDSDSLIATLHRVASVDPPPIRERAPDVPEWLASVIDQLLAKDPDDRFQTAKEVELALRAGLSGVSPNPAPARAAPVINTEAPARARNPSKRKSGFPVITVCLIAIGLLTAAIFIATRPRSDERPSTSPRAVADPNERTVDEPDRSISPFQPRFRSISDTGRVTQFSSLERAIEEADDDTRIEIHTNESIRVTEMYLEQSRLTLAAGENYTPTLVFPQVGEEGSMIVTSSHLRLEGVNLECAASHEGTALVMIEAGSFEADQCRFRTAGDVVCIAAEEPRSIVLNDCELHSTAESCFDLTLDGDAEVTFRRCFITGNAGCYIEPYGEARLSFVNSIIVASRIAELGMAESDGATLLISAKGTLFMSQEAMLIFDDPTMQLSDFQRAIRWQGVGNLYSGPLVALDSDIDLRSAAWASDLESWRSLTDDRESLVTDQPFTLEDESVWEVVEDRDYPKDRLQLTQESEKHLAAYAKSSD